MKKALEYAAEHQTRFVSELKDLLRIKSISTDATYQGEVHRAAEWVASHLLGIGMQTAVVHGTGGHPIVTAEYHAGDGLPTVLVYGHYDVQPPDPLDQWKTPPFEPTEKNGDLYARGASDDKGQMFMHAKAAEAYLATGGLPINLKFLVEGEEESGSIHLRPFIEAHQAELSSDLVLISDTALFGDGIPSITFGLRGLAYVEVILKGPNRDLHSGVYGGAVENPINALARIIGSLHDQDHRVTIPGFNENVRELTEEERKEIRELPFDEKEWLGSVGLSRAWTETGSSVLEAIWTRPTLDVNGIWGGYQGEGAKTVLPSVAGAKISMRLVPDQRPDELVSKLKHYLEAVVPPTMTMEFRDLHGGQAVIVDTSTPAMQAALTAMEDVFGKKARFVREGGSIPVVADFKQVMGIDTVLMGFGLNSDAIHSPNEHFGLDRFRKGIEASIRFMHALGG